MSNKTKNADPDSADTRTKTLVAEFDSMNPHHKSVLCIKDVEEFFARSPFDCDKMQLVKAFLFFDSSHKHRVSRGDYVRRCLEAESLALAKLEEHQQNIRCFSQQVEEVMRKLAESKASEKLNRHGIMEDSSLTIWVTELKGFFPQDLRTTISPYVTIKVGEQRLRTACANTMLDPVWNEDLTFNIATGEERIRIEVSTNEEEISRHRFEAYCEMSMDDLRDQQKQERLLDLRNPAGRPIPGRVHIFVQWVYSGVQYFADLMKRMQDKLDLEHKFSDDTTAELGKLREPYGLLLHYNPAMLDSLQPQGPQSYTTSVVGTATSDSQFVASSVLRPSHSFLMCDNLLWMLFILSSMLNAFLRADFVNITVGVLGIATNVMAGNKEPERKIRLGLFCLTFALIFDVVWFSLLSSVRFNSQNAGILCVNGLNCLLKLLLYFRLKQNLVDAAVISLLEFDCCVGNRHGTMGTQSDMINDSKDSLSPR